MDKLKILSQEGVYIAMLNPNSLKQGYGIEYTNNECNNRQAQGNLAPKVELKGYKSEKLSFEIIIDATGAVDQLITIPVPIQFKLLKSVIYDYYGDKHEPYPVIITWGTLIFKGRLTSMDITYQLFDSYGVPLRATVSLSFDEYLTDKEKEKLAKNSSPDLTHIVEFKAGDTLPQLCQKIYNDSSYYMDVARANQLVSVRQIMPGTKLYFPPLI
ncbi:hypothetical protein V6259_02560 [Marinomonas sp. TI.3.20]|uniref:CIS tube protein n=1 Tax=Marinomonas sp. TI.3.20 TaxID=3121296 RepID=UPI00311E4F44